MSEIRPKFITAYTLSEALFEPTNPGSPIQEVYAEQIDSITKEPKFVKVGERDLDELHQRDLEGTDINILAKRYFSGDLGAIEQMADVMYGDSSILPSDSLEAANLMLFARQAFDNLPLDEKDRFHGNYLEWVDKVSSLDKVTLENAGLAKFMQNDVSGSADPENGVVKDDE